ESPAGAVFWYENANGLVEIAVNGGSAGTALGLQPGATITLL
ncbi:MAG: SAM hydroxide adenosyltransferase, partial [Sulfuricaulis sp.]